MARAPNGRVRRVSGAAAIRRRASSNSIADSIGTSSSTSGIELAAAPPGTVPTSVRDAVLTRVLGLPEPAQQAPEAPWVVPAPAER